MYIVSQDWESERFVYSDNEKEELLSDLTDWLFENDVFYADYLENNTGTLYHTHCLNSAAEAIDCAESYGSWVVADLTICVY